MTLLPLKPKAKIALLTPSYGCSEKIITKCEDYISTLGFEPVVYPCNPNRKYSPMIENKLRIDPLIDAFSDDAIDAIWPLSGGFGTAYGIEELVKCSTLSTKPKLLIGFSDITLLHLFVNQQLQWPSLHAPVLRQIVMEQVDTITIVALELALKEAKLPDIKERAAVLNKAADKFDLTSKTFTGGNLAVIQTSIGTNWQCSAKGKVLFLEDTDERAYRVERMLLHLEQAGIITDVAAICFGDFDNENDKSQELLIEEVINNFAKKTKLPVFLLPGSGHKKTNLPIIFS